MRGDLAAVRGAKHSLEAQVEQEVATNREQLDSMSRSETLLKEREQVH